MPETIDTGTQPSLTQDPLENAELISPVFDFPGGLRQERDSGPYGAKPGDLPQWKRPPLLGEARPPGSLRTITLLVTPTAAPTWQRVPVNRPTVLLPFRVSGFPAGTLQLEVTYVPGAALDSIIPGGSHGLMSSRGACYLWSPGDWYVALGPNGPALSTVDFVMVPAEDRSVAEALLRPWEHGTRGAVRTATVTLVAAVANTLLELDVVLFRDYVRVTNTGANQARVEFVSIGANEGLFLNAGASLEFFGRTLPMARLRALSTLGTSIQVDVSQRSFNG